MLRTLLLATMLAVFASPAEARDEAIEARAAPPAMAGDVRSALAALKREPNVRAVQEAALRYFKVNMDKVNSLRAGAAYKALVPVVEVAGGYVQSNLADATVNQEWHSTDIYTERGVDAWAWELRGKATWNLPQLVFNPEELDVASLAGLMEGILKESTRLYYMRRRLQVDLLLSPPRDVATQITKELRLEELTALLDAMTGGWFQRELEGRPQDR